MNITYTALYRAHLKSLSPLSGGSFFTSENTEKLPPQAWEDKVWRERFAINEKGNVIVRAMCFKFALVEAARYASKPVPGKGKKTFTKLFESSVQVLTDADLGVTRDEATKITIMADSRGIRGGSSRVPKHMPTLFRWESKIDIQVLDQIIDDSELMEHLQIAGRFCGVGQFRIGRGGTNGRFEVAKLERIGK